ncbi:hypothetical protein FT641_27220 [Bacillus paranthracis]|uniref:hypothetical protein n=1 Tax=Bacillus paranthracis TaxID=2026186 RepID=UPI000BFE9F98|nr:hypothetical protein [Bacillus paranthracis]MBE7117266.1 hypothetical protein [Bacillus paranthracis]MBE7134880.1 hypothetical protein [Bacillus paranthracis]MBE7156368.1 hypothetical protein [Bacillus paranthracis]PGZ29500.1 hypothetical protein COE50_22055 [Bacillus anthracis]
MANTQRGESKITLGDKEFDLRYDLNAFVEIEEAMGVPMSEIGNIKISMKNIRSMLRAGVLHEHPEMTEREIGSLVTMENFAEVQKAVAVAFGSAKAKN